MLTRTDFGDGLDRAWYVIATVDTGGPQSASALESFEM